MICRHYCVPNRITPQWQSSAPSVRTSPGIFGIIAEACAGLDVQVVLSLGGGGKQEDMEDLGGEPIVVEFAPQLELLKRAALCITHAGLNTALECLSNGVPMVAIPITNDQPGVAARIEWTGTGEMVSVSKLSIAKLRTEVASIGRSAVSGQR